MVAETRADMPTVDTVAAEVTAQAGTEEATVAQVAATVEEAAEAEAVAVGETELKRLKAMPTPALQIPIVLRHRESPSASHPPQTSRPTLPPGLPPQTKVPTV